MEPLFPGHYMCNKDTFSANKTKCIVQSLSHLDLYMFPVERPHTSGVIPSGFKFLCLHKPLGRRLWELHVCGCQHCPNGIANLQNENHMCSFLLEALGNFLKSKIKQRRNNALTRGMSSAISCSETRNSSESKKKFAPLAR